MAGVGVCRWGARGERADAPGPQRSRRWWSSTKRPPAGCSGGYPCADSPRRCARLAHRTPPSLAFSGDGTRLALAITTGQYSTAGTRTDPGPGEAHAFVWSLADGRELFHDVLVLPARVGRYRAGRSVADGARLALSHIAFDSSNLDRSTRYCGDLRVVDVADGRERIHVTSAPRVTPPRPSAPTAGSWPLSRRRGRERLGDRTTGRLKVFDVETGRPGPIFRIRRWHPSVVRFSPNAASWP